MKKIKFFLILLLLTALLIFSLKKHLISALIHLNILKPCYDRLENFTDLYLQEGFNYSDFDQLVTTDSYAKLININDYDNKNSIPLLSHNVFLTSATKPAELNSFYLEILKNNFLKLNKANNSWRHYIWVNNEDVIPAKIKDLEGVEIKSIKLLKDHQLYEELATTIEKAEQNKAYFAESADLVRLLVIQKFGGVYADMDYEIYNPQELEKFLSKFDFIGGREMTLKYSNYGNAFFAAKPGHPVINEALGLIHRNYYKLHAPSYIKYPCRESVRIYFNGPPVITISYFKKNNLNGNNDIILPSWMVFNARFARFKNKTCNYNQISSEEFNKNNQNLEKLIDEYSKNPIAEGPEEVPLENLYYHINKNDNFTIIGADMFCGNWIVGSNFKRKYYWNW